MVAEIDDHRPRTNVLTFTEKTLTVSFSLAMIAETANHRPKMNIFNFAKLKVSISFSEGLLPSIWRRRAPSNVRSFFFHFLLFPHFFSLMYISTFPPFLIYCSFFDRSSFQTASCRTHIRRPGTRQSI